MDNLQPQKTSNRKQEPYPNPVSDPQRFGVPEPSTELEKKSLK